MLAALAACGKPLSGPQALQPIASLPAPVVPPWISQVAPIGAAKTSAQIRVIFASPVLPIEQLGSAQERDVLSHFRLTPALPGAFVVLTPRMIGFQSDSALPPSTRMQVTLTAGLRDLAGHTLDRDLAWTFHTPNLDVSVPEDEPSPGTVDLTPVVRIIATTSVDEASLAAHAHFVSTKGGNVGVRVAHPSPSPGDDGNLYSIVPDTTLARATHYELRIDAGVMPASGNLGSVKPLTIAMDTYSPLLFAGAEPTADPMTSTNSARFAKGDPALVFTNALDPKTFAQHLAVIPPLRTVGQPYQLSDDDGSAVLVNPYALAPNTTYTFTFDADLQDVYGQRLGKSVRTTYDTGNYAGYFWAPNGTNRFISTQRLQLQYMAINLPGNHYRARYRAIDPATMANTDPYDTSSLLGDPSTWPQITAPPAAINTPLTISVPLAQELGAPAGVLAYGAGADVGGSSSYTGMVELTNLGVFAQWFPQSGTVMVQRLSDGAPVGNARVDVYVAGSQYPTKIPARLCASGTTSPDGSLAIVGYDVERCYMGDRPVDQAPELFVVARSGSDWSYVRTYGWSGVYQYASTVPDATWSSGQPISYGTIFSDRQMYQPGERGWFTAACFVLQNGQLRADRNASYRVTLRDPNGNETRLADQTTNRYATFSFPIDFKKTQALGYYTIDAKSPDGADITGSFRVAEFRPPNFSVNLKVDQKYAAAGATENVSGSAQYLFGAPMSGATAKLHVTRQQTTVSPSGWDDFTFGRQWFWPEQQPDVEANAGEQQVALDTNGEGTATVGVDRNLPYPMTYTLDLEVTDVSNLASSATQSFTALPSETLIGLRSDFVGTANTAIPVAVIATDPSGKALPGTSVHLELQKMEYSGVTQIVEGAESARNQVQYVTEAQADVTTGTQAQTVSLVPKGAGSYRIRANVAGASSEATATDTQVWVTGPGEALWGEQNPSQLQLKLDKKTYRPGDVAIVAVASPYEKADLYLSVVRDRVLYKTVVHVDGSAPKVRVLIAQSMFPNAAVEGVLVRRGAPISNSSAAVDSLVRIGMVPLQLDIKDQYLQLGLSAAHARLAPHATQQIHLQVRDASGKPVRAQVTIAVVNDAILQLSGYRLPDLVQTVFAAQPISTRFADNRPDVTLTQPSDVAQKGWGYGGGFLAGAAGTRVRTQFAPLAYFNGAVQTDASGNASVSFTAPDNLTTWRVLAVAVTAEDRPRFATSDSTFITTKPLVTDPLLPQFARPGDRFDAGMLLMNAGAESVDARTQALLSGVLSFASPTGSQRLDAEQQFDAGMNAWRFPLVVNGAGNATMQFTTTIGPSGSDAFRVPLEVRTADVNETTMDAGATTTSVAIPLTIGKTGGTVRIDLAGSIVPQVVGTARTAFAQDPLAILSPISSRLSVAASVLSIERITKAKAEGLNAAAEGAADVVQLASMQRIDGGFSPWPNADASDLFGSADTVRSLAEAKASGIAVPPLLLEKAKPFLVRALANPAGIAKACSSAACTARARLSMLRALAALGDRRTDFLQSIDAGNEMLDFSDRVELALYMLRTPPWEARGSELASELMKAAYITGRYANVQPENGSYSSLVQAQAAYLELLVARGATEEDQARAVKALVAQQCRCGWPALDDAAAALRAIVSYAAAQRTPTHFTVRVDVDGKPVGSAPFGGPASPVHTITLDRLTAGQHTVTLSREGSGTLHYLLAYSYAVAPDAPGQLAGLRVRRTLRVVNTQVPLATMDIQAQAAPLTLPAGNVYDVTVQVITDHPVDRVVITDPIPAGLEALDTSFLTTAAYYQPLSDDWQIDYQQIYKDRITAFAQHLNPGVYTFHYLARSVTPGVYLWPGTSAYLLDAPEQFGRASFDTVNVK